MSLKFLLPFFALSLISLTGCQQMINGTSPPSEEEDDDDDGDDDLPTTEVFESSSQLRLGDRYFVESVFRNIFATNAQVNAAISTLVQGQLPEFGNGCDKFGIAGDNCNAVYQNSLLPVVTPITSLREAYRLRACYFVLSRHTIYGEQDRPLREAVAKAKGVDISLVNLDGVAFPTALEVRNAYQLFFPEIEPSTDLVTKLTAVAQANTGYGVREPWRFLFITLCTSPAWQAP